MDHEEEANTAPQNETNKAPATNHKEMEIYNTPDKEFRIIILKKLSEMQENINDVHGIKKRMHEQNEKFGK